MENNKNSQHKTKNKKRDMDLLRMLTCEKMDQREASPWEAETNSEKKMYNSLTPTTITDNDFLLS